MSPSLPSGAPARVAAAMSTLGLVALSVAALPSPASAAGSVPCYGDGVSGQRVQLVYAVASDQVDSYASVAPLIASAAASMDSIVMASAAQTGGVRHIRFVTNADCSPNVAHVVVSPTGDDSLASTETELQAKGYGSVSRKYLIWMDASFYCGMSDFWGDDSPSPATNLSNTQLGYARVDRGCWNSPSHSAPLHELLHTLGAVSPSAPHGTASGHCTDESDLMCQMDSTGFFTQSCPTSNEPYLDCNHDDYFSTAPPAGSYLATHWNVANSPFLSLDDAGTPASTAVGPMPATSTVTDTFSGSVSSKKTTARYAVSLVQGDTGSALTFSSSAKSKTPATLRLRVLDTSGSAVLTGSGPSVLRLVGSLPTGSYTWEVYGTTSISFSLAVTHLT